MYFIFFRLSVHLDMGQCYSTSLQRDTSTFNPSESTPFNNNYNNFNDDNDNHVADNIRASTDNIYSDSQQSLHAPWLSENQSEINHSSLASFVIDAPPEPSAPSLVDNCRHLVANYSLVHLLNAATMQSLNVDARIQNLQFEIHILKKNLQSQQTAYSKLLTANVDLEKQMALQLFDLLLHKGLLEHAEHSTTAQAEQLKHVSLQLSTTLQRLHEAQEEIRSLSLQLLDFTTINQ